jgi:UDP-3-O-[3-hydroxymyristoyl] glucosamine N-acyltransferase
MNSKLNLLEIEKIVNGKLHLASGSDLSSSAQDICITGIKPLELATKDDLSFFSPNSIKQTAELFALAKSSKAGVLFVKTFQSEFLVPQIVVPHPLGAVVKLSHFLYKKPQPNEGVHSTAIIDPSAEVHPSARIGAYVVIGAGVKIAANVIIHPHVVIYDLATLAAGVTIHSSAVIREFSQIGPDCVIQNGVVVGGDGFGYFPEKVDGVTVKHQRIPHLGHVVLEEGVDIGANSTVDRATFGETRIKKNTKIDNLVMIGHNVVVGERTLLCAQVGISGSSTIGNDVTLAGQVGVADHTKVGDNVRAAGKTGLYGTVEGGVDLAGFPYRLVAEWRKEFAVLRKLPKLYKALKKLDSL